MCLGPQTVTQIVATALGLLPEIGYFAVQRGPDPAMGSGLGQQPSYMRQFTGSGLHLEFNPKAHTLMICVYLLSVPKQRALRRSCQGKKVSLRFSCNDTELLSWCLGLFLK